jgi:hypothetical protein
LKNIPYDILEHPESFDRINIKHDAPSKGCGITHIITEWKKTSDWVAVVDRVAYTFRLPEQLVRTGVLS